MILIKDVKREAIAKLSGKWGVSIGVLVLYILISMGLSSLTNVIKVYTGSTPLYIVLTILSIIITTLIAFGIINFFVLLSREEAVAVGDSFYGFKNSSLKAIGVMILSQIFIFLWTLLLIIPGIVAYYKYAFALYILRDNPDMEVTEAIKKSKELVYGYKGKLLLFQLSFIGWILLCIVTFGIAALWVAPYINTATAVFYNKLLELKKIS
ncbi:membrane protein [Clostridium polyendosporum]|uniref:Membrane protein n=1 Tax=Clostridium polyendosporum TaxID=69208 RepID=A0A919S193_9CLOT|nr:DUF975 family protein [Clostridium polyendosporum]GIM29584.1 membrane protein [Clostridium polyendosporum]